jgi:hypothetical protein
MFQKDLNLSHAGFLVSEAQSYTAGLGIWQATLPRPCYQAARKATILLDAPALNRHPKALAEFANRIFCFYDMQGELEAG